MTDTLLQHHCHDSRADTATVTVPGVDERSSELLTVDELAAATGLTVRTARYYAGLGLLPPPERRGRMAYYSAEHKARLELIRALQDHGFTLAAIERYLSRLPADASVEELAVQRAMLTSWTATPVEVVDRDQLEERAGRPLGAALIDRLIASAAIRSTEDGRYELLPAFELSIRGLDLKVPVDSLVMSSEAIGRHMSALADELTEILKERVLAPRREQRRSSAEDAEFEQTMGQLRQFTLDAVVVGFQQAANEVISRSLTRSR